MMSHSRVTANLTKQHRRKAPRTPNFKGKQNEHVYGCRCCWTINDKREKLEKIREKSDLEN